MERKKKMDKVKKIKSESRAIYSIPRQKIKPSKKVYNRKKKSD